MTYYQQQIEKELKKMNISNIDPRHVEAYMRIGHSTLDGLSKAMFSKEVAIGVKCIQEDGINNAESLAKSYSL